MHGNDYSSRNCRGFSMRWMRCVKFFRSVWSHLLQLTQGEWCVAGLGHHSSTSSAPQYTHWQPRVPKPSLGTYTHSSRKDAASRCCFLRSELHGNMLPHHHACLSSNWWWQDLFWKFNDITWPPVLWSDVARQTISKSWIRVRSRNSKLSVRIRRWQQGIEIKIVWRNWKILFSCN